jgi:hypothetical protein
MERFRSGGWALASAIVIAGILPTAAAADRGHFTSPAMHFSEFELPASNGYRIQVADTGGRQIYLTASNGGSSVTYTVRGKKTDRDGIEARFPGVGRISVRFEQVGKTEHAPPADNCKGDGSDTQRGVFRGAIVFNGENGFAKARASRAGGTVLDSAKEVCKRQKEGKGGSAFHSTFLSAFASRGKGLLSFIAAKLSSDSLPAGDLTVYSASLAQFKGAMSVSHTVSMRSASKSFALGEPSAHPTTASVAPPSPFAGSANFQLESGSTASWTGGLSVDLPGYGPVSLTGSKFSAELCVDDHCSGSRKKDNGHFVAVVVGARGRVTLPTRATAPSPRPWPR